MYNEQQNHDNDIPWYLQDLLSKEDDHPLEKDNERQDEGLQNHNNNIGKKKNDNEYYNDVIDWNPQNNKDIHFQPFLGNEDDLKALLEHYNSKYEKKNQIENYNYSSSFGHFFYTTIIKYESFYILMVFMFGVIGYILFFMILYRHHYNYLGNCNVQIEDKDYSDAIDKTYGADKIDSTALGNSQQNETSTACHNDNDQHNDNLAEGVSTFLSTTDITHRQPTLCPNTVQNETNNETHHNKYENDTIANCTKQSSEQDKFRSIPSNHRDNNNTDLSEVFLHDIPIMAEMVSLSGLDRQESIKLVAKEVLATNRRHKEEIKKQQKEILIQLECKAKQALNELAESIGSIICGSHFVTCILLGCSTRFFLSHFNYIQEFLFYNEDKLSSPGLDSIMDLFSTNICNCILETSSSTTDPIANHHMIKDDVSNNNNIMNLSPSSTSCIGYSFFSSLLPSLTSILTSILNISSLSSTSSILVTKCILKLSCYIITISLIHRIIQIFHSTTIHFIFNMMIFIFIMMNSSLGRCVIILMTQIFIFNIILGSIGYIYNYKQKKNLFYAPMLQYCNNANGDDELNTRSMIQAFQIILIESEDMVWKLYSISSLFAIILGVLSLYY